MQHLKEFRHSQIWIYNWYNALPWKFLCYVIYSRPVKWTEYCNSEMFENIKSSKLGLSTNNVNKSRLKS